MRPYPPLRRLHRRPHLCQSSRHANGSTGYLPLAPPWSVAHHLLLLPAAAAAALVRAGHLVVALCPSDHVCRCPDGLASRCTQSRTHLARCPPRTWQAAAHLQLLQRQQKAAVAAHLVVLWCTCDALQPPDAPLSSARRRLHPLGGNRTPGPGRRRAASHQVLRLHGFPVAAAAAKCIRRVCAIPHLGSSFGLEWHLSPCSAHFWRHFYAPLEVSTRVTAERMGGKRFALQAGLPGRDIHAMEPISIYVHIMSSIYQA